MARIKTSEEELCSVEESLGDIKDKGCDVRYKKQSNSDNVEPVLWVQTKDMKDQLVRSAPRVFECDTTFGTQVRYCKQYRCCIYFSFLG